MESDVPQAVGLQQLGKAGRDIVWLEDCANFVDADIAQLVFHIASAAQLAVLCLHLFLLQQPLLHKGDQRKRPHT